MLNQLHCLNLCCCVIKSTGTIFSISFSGISFPAQPHYPLTHFPMVVFIHHHILLCWSYFSTKLSTFSTSLLHHQWPHNPIDAINVSFLPPMGFFAIFYDLILTDVVSIIPNLLPVAILNNIYASFFIPEPLWPHVSIFHHIIFYPHIHLS